MSSQQWLKIGKEIAGFDRSMQWIIGDWWAYGADRKYGDGEALAEAVGLDYGTLRTYAGVSRAYELSIRIDNLSHLHHRIVAGRDDRGEWLERAEAGDVDPQTGEARRWSVKRLKDAVKAHDKAERDRQRAGRAGGTATMVQGDSVEWLRSLVSAAAQKQPGAARARPPAAAQRPGVGPRPAPRRRPAVAARPVHHTVPPRIPLPGDSAADAEERNVKDF
jgi:hypothetical protein